ALYRVGSSSFTAHSESVHHFTRLAVNDGSLLAQMIRTDGTIGDEVMLMKGGVPLPPRCGDGVVNQPGEQCDGADRAACGGTRATLMQHCIDGSDDGGAIYPVADSRWVEGDRTGLDVTSALGPGLKWSDVDTNGDVVVDTRDTSPWLPQFARAMRGFGSVVAGRDFTVDVTPAFQAGPGLYALAITTNSSNKVTYSSRESATPPVLRVELAPPGTTTTTSTTTTTNTTSTTATPPTTSTTLPATTTSTTSTTTTTSTTSSTVPTTSTTVPATTTSTTTTSTSTTTTPTSPSATTSTTTSVVPSTTTLPPGTTSTTTPPDECQTDADCGRDDPCRPRRCVAHRCQDAPLMGLEAVRCALAPEGEQAPACGGKPLPRTLNLAFGRTRAA